MMQELHMTLTWSEILNVESKTRATVTEISSPELTKSKLAKNIICVEGMCTLDFP